MKRKMSFLVLMVFLALLIPTTSVQAKKLNKRDGVNYFGEQKETYYNLPMDRIYQKADKEFGSHHKKWIRSDGCKMYGPYIICAGPVEMYGEIVETSLGEGIILDTGAFCLENKHALDLATTW